MRPASVCAATPIWTPPVLADDPRFVVEKGIYLRLFGDRLRHGAHEERQDRQLRAAFALLAVEPGAEVLERGHVGFLDIDDVGDAAARDCHFLGDLATQTDDGDFLDARIRRAARARAGAAAAAHEQVEVIMADAPRRPRTGDAAEIDPGVGGALADGRRGERLLAFLARRA